MVRSTRRTDAGHDLVSIPRAVNDAQGRGRHHRISGAPLAAEVRGCSLSGA